MQKEYTAGLCADQLCCGVIFGKSDQLRVLVRMSCDLCLLSGFCGDQIGLAGINLSRAEYNVTVMLDKE